MDYHFTDRCDDVMYNDDEPTLEKDSDDNTQHLSDHNFDDTSNYDCYQSTCVDTLTSANKSITGVDDNTVINGVNEVKNNGNTNEDDNTCGGENFNVDTGDSISGQDNINVSNVGDDIFGSVDSDNTARNENMDDIMIHDTTEDDAREQAAMDENLIPFTDINTTGIATRMDAKYGKWTNPKKLRHQKLRDYSHIHTMHNTMRNKRAKYPKDYGYFYAMMYIQESQIHLYNIMLSQ